MLWLSLLIAFTFATVSGTVQAKVNSTGVLLVRIGSLNNVNAAASPSILSNFGLKKSFPSYKVVVSLYDQVMETVSVRGKSKVNFEQWMPFSLTEYEKKYPIEISVLADRQPFAQVKVPVEQWLPSNPALKLTYSWPLAHNASLTLSFQYISQELSVRSFWLEVANQVDQNNDGKLSKQEREHLYTWLQLPSTNLLRHYFTNVDLIPIKEFIETHITTMKIYENEASLRHLNQCPYCPLPAVIQTLPNLFYQCAACVIVTARKDKRVESVAERIPVAVQAQRSTAVQWLRQLGFGRVAVHGAHSTDIIVMDRATGQLVEEKIDPILRMVLRGLYAVPFVAKIAESTKLLKWASEQRGKMMNDPDSRKWIEPFVKQYGIDLSQFIIPEGGFPHFNAFFYRQLKPGKRPIPENNKVLVSAADSRVTAYPNLKETQKYWIKGNGFTLDKLLHQNQSLLGKVRGGSLMILRLAPQDYHRFHSPVDGTIQSIEQVQGAYYSVNRFAVQSDKNVLAENKRTIITVASPVFGTVAVVAIGATLVASIITTRKAGDQVNRGDELGYFAFGGSTIVLCFEPNRVQFDQDILDNSTKELETLLPMGSRVGIAFK